MIICFSGNGNSRLVANELANNLGMKVLDLKDDILVNPSSHAIDNDSKAIVWVFPVYSWGIPPVVKRFIESITISNASNVSHHLVVTCGDDAGHVDKQWRELLIKRGWKPRSASTVLMPNTYVCMKGFDIDSEAVAREKLQKSKQRILEISGLINKDSSASSITRGTFPWIKSNIIYPWFIKHEMSSKPFHYTSDCTGCGLCSRQCPMDNITMNHRGAPTWGNNCAMCLRCYHRCPVHAVAYGKKTRDKGQYRGPQEYL